MILKGAGKMIEAIALSVACVLILDVWLITIRFAFKN